MLNQIEKFKSNICFIEESGKKTLYKNALEEGERLCKDLNPRSLIFVLCQNNVEFFVGYLAFFRKQLVQMLLNANISSNLLNELINTYLPKYIFLY